MTGKDKVPKTKFPSRAEVKRFLDKLRKLGVLKEGTHCSFEVMLTHHYTGKKEAKCRFYLDWRDVFPLLKSCDGPWLSGYHGDLENLFVTVKAMKDELEEGLFPTEVGSDKE